MRLIDADALDAAFTDLRFNADGTLAHWGDRPDWCLYGRDVEKLIHDAPTVAADINVPGKWISVDDRLPNDTKPVYVWLGRGSGLRSGIPFVGRYDPFCSGVWRIYGLDGDRPDIIKITHWMPLPEPPEEENECNTD